MTFLGVYWPMVFWEGTFGYLWLHFLHLQLHVIFKVSLPQTNISTSQLKIPSLIGHQMGTSAQVVPSCASSLFVHVLLVNIRDTEQFSTNLSSW